MLLYDNVIDHLNSTSIRKEKQVYKYKQKEENKTPKDMSYLFE